MFLACRTDRYNTSVIHVIHATHAGFDLVTTEITRVIWKNRNHRQSVNVSLGCRKIVNIRYELFGKDQIFFLRYVRPITTFYARFNQGIVILDTPQCLMMRFMPAQLCLLKMFKRLWYTDTSENSHSPEIPCLHSAHSSPFSPQAQSRISGK